MVLTKHAQGNTMSVIDYQLGATILKVSNVSLSLEDRVILRDVNVEIRDIIQPGRCVGQVSALLGPSGVGKTRFFRLLAGLDDPTTGTIAIGEKGEPVERGKVGVVAQDYPLFPHRTILGNLLIAGRMAGLPAAEARHQADDFLARFRLQDYAARYPCQLSGGQRQRVAIAQQFMCSEHFLLMDEPFSGLDPLAIESVIELISEVANADELNTIIVVTHDISAAIAVADHIWLLGRDRDAEGNPLPGARLQENYNLLKRGLAWRKGIQATPEFQALLTEIRTRFATL
jgi:polar amino acid transport system ATP-binding protein/sulfate transport system ATP-binding protein